MTELTSLLTDHALDTLRGAYVESAMLAGAQAAVCGRWPAAAGWAKVVAGDVYDSPHQRPADRERCVIVLQAANGHAFGLAVHVYWGLMEGLSVADIAQTLLVVGTYCGLDAYVRSSEHLASALTVLAEIAGAENGDCTPRQVMGELKQVFG